MEKYCVSITRSENKEQAQKRFLDAIKVWIDSCIEKYKDIPVLLNQHDQGTFVTAWEPYICVTGETYPLVFMKHLRDKIAASAHEHGEWKHGYWTYNEAHHGTEHFELFLGALFRLDPTDQETIREIDDAAEHFGNWVSEVPAWFDWNTNLYHSMFFGTEKVGAASADKINIPDHLRCGNIALLAYDATQNIRYLKLAKAVYDQWVKAILQEDSLPLAITENGGIYTLSAQDEEVYRSFVGALPASLDEPVDRAENMMASGGVSSLLKLWEQTHQEKYKAAARRLTDVLAMTLSDPDAGAAVAAVREYDSVTGENRYTDRVLQAYKECFHNDFNTLTIEACRRSGKRPSGVGKRNDMSIWYEGNHVRSSSPILLCYAAQLLHDDNLAAWVYDLCTAYLTAARAVYPDGRDHGCSAQSVSAIARGHGRENHVGIITGVLPYL